jgi:hypothetical protein
MRRIAGRQEMVHSGQWPVKAKWMNFSKLSTTPWSNQNGGNLDPTLRVA